MLVEVPELEVWVSVIVAFFVGLFVLFIAYKIKSLSNSKNNVDEQYELDRLEYYEKQLIDMKIRLDAFEVSNVVEKPVASYQKPMQKTQDEHIQQDDLVRAQNQSTKPRNIGYGDVINHVLELITIKPMTSRDIQITIGRSREHTSRMMNKMYKDGYVQRNTNSKPYTYSITEKGKLKLEQR